MSLGVSLVRINGINNGLKPCRKTHQIIG
jgi:hypothetical protein